jgi:hypothetical protein
MFAVILYCFVICAIAFIVGANTGQTCTILKEAINKNDTFQNMVIQWATKNANESYELCKACLFGMEPPLSYYLSAFDATAVSSMAASIIAHANEYKTNFEGNQFNNKTILKIQSDFEYYQDDPETQNAGARTQLDALNKLTNVADEDCKINDMWVFSERDCTPDYPKLNDNIPVGDKACLVFLLVDETVFNKRYQEYTVRCDPENKIKATYTPLYSYAFTSKNVFGTMAHTYSSNYLANWGNTHLSLETFNYFSSNVIALSEYTQSVMDNYTSTKIDNKTDCTGMKKSIDNLKVYACKWSASVSLYCLLLWIFAIIGIIYAFLRINYIRHMNYKTINKVDEKFVKFLPKEQREDQPKEVKI